MSLLRLAIVTFTSIGLSACGGGGSGNTTSTQSPAPSSTGTTVTISSTLTKIDNSGNRLPASATSWSCVSDSATGLMWEVKTNDGGLRDQNWVYTSYETTGSNGNGVCDATKTCNQSYFKDAVNAGGLCGYKDWRLAKVTELESLIDRTQPQAPFINSQYFPMTKAGKYWTTTAAVSASNQNVWWVDFSTATSASTFARDLKFHVRLVRP